MLNENRLHHFHFQKSISFESGRLFCQPEFLPVGDAAMCAAAGSVDHVLFINEATFSRENAFNASNSYLWAIDNPHAMRPYAYQQRFCVNM